MYEYLDKRYALALYQVAEEKAGSLLALHENLFTTEQEKQEFCEYIKSRRVFK